MLYLFLLLIGLYGELLPNLEGVPFLETHDEKVEKTRRVFDKQKTVCLNMIVKNESKVIKRCLGSLKHLIDYWVIVDTGSEDGTQGIVREFLKDVPGELHEKKWVNFEENRNHALNLAKDKADYVLFIDADEELIFDEHFVMPELDSDGYFITCGCEGMQFLRVGLINTKLNWKWEGVLHEVVICDEAKSFKKLEKVHNLVRREGCRSQDPDILQKDIKIFEDLLKKNPKDSRTVFYLANTCFQAKNFSKALEYYIKRCGMTENDEEVYLSLLSIAQIYQRMNKPLDLIAESYYKAYTMRPNRIEPLFFLANYYRMKKKFHEAFTIASLGVKIRFPSEKLFIEKWIYDYGIFFELAMSALEIKRYTDAYLAFIKVTSEKIEHQHMLDKSKENLKVLEKKIIAGEIPGIKLNKSRNVGH